MTLSETAFDQYLQAMQDLQTRAVDSQNAVLMEVADSFIEAYVGER